MRFLCQNMCMFSSSCCHYYVGGIWLESVEQGRTALCLLSLLLRRCCNLLLANAQGQVDAATPTSHTLWQLVKVTTTKTTATATLLAMSQPWREQQLQQQQQQLHALIVVIVIMLLLATVVAVSACCCGCCGWWLLTCGPLSFLCNVSMKMLSFLWHSRRNAYFQSPGSSGVANFYEINQPITFFVMPNKIWSAFGGQRQFWVLFVVYVTAEGKTYFYRKRKCSSNRKNKRKNIHTRKRYERPKKISKY